MSRIRGSISRLGVIIDIGNAARLPSRFSLEVGTGSCLRRCPHSHGAEPVALM